MKTEPIYLKDSYKKSCEAKVLKISQNGVSAKIVLDKTVFYPVGGGQPSDQGLLQGSNASFKVEQVTLQGDEIIHSGKFSQGTLKVGDKITCVLDWKRRYGYMQIHTAGHLLHEAVISLFPKLIPLEGKHGSDAYIKYKGHLDSKKALEILNECNSLRNKNLAVHTEFVSIDELKKRASHVPSHLPTNKPLRVVWFEGFKPIPDGGTQLKSTRELPEFEKITVENQGENVSIHYTLKVAKTEVKATSKPRIRALKESINPDSDSVMNLKNQALSQIMDAASAADLESLRIQYLGRQGKISLLINGIKNLHPDKRKAAGALINDVKNTLVKEISERTNSFNENARVWFDPTVPGLKPTIGHTHLVTGAINEIQSVFEKIGFVRMRYPEVEWDWFSFGSLNFTKDHPARDDWETFLIDTPANKNLGPMVLTPHTSSGQVRETERVKNPPIRMINIGKCYRRQSDASHVPMFHQFEGLVIDKGINITHLKGTLDYFAKSFFGPERKTRLRPYNFPFTEPSFEVDITCDICKGKGCKVCKGGWLELGGAGMVHPNVMKSGNIDTSKYTGFAFGWGVERVLMMKSGLKVPDLRLLYSTDLRFLSQF